MSKEGARRGREEDIFEQGEGMKDTLPADGERRTLPIRDEDLQPERPD